MLVALIRLDGWLRRSLRAGVLALAAAVLAFALACTQSARATHAASPAATSRRVLLISIDGFRWDYLERPQMVRLRALAARGTRAERLVPSFPTKTFPNHYTLVTGLYPGEHGIVANAFRDSTLGFFRLSDTAAQHDVRWWGGEPIWRTAERQGVRAAVLFWPGSEAPIGGGWATYWAKYNEAMPNAQRVRRLLEFLAIPGDTAPRLVVGYFSTVDAAGHDHGPMSAELNAALAAIDSTVGSLVDGIARLGLTDDVDIVVVSDHGMMETVPERTIVLDSLIDLTNIDVVDVGAVTTIAPRPEDVDRVYAKLKNAHPHLRVYRKGELPANWHFNTHPRITPIVAVADDGWITVRASMLWRWRAAGGRPQGQHGYPPEWPVVGALFIAAGPDIAQGKVVPPFQNVHVYPLLARLLAVAPAPNSGSLDSVRAVLR